MGILKRFTKTQTPGPSVRDIHVRLELPPRWKLTVALRGRDRRADDGEFEICHLIPGNFGVVHLSIRILAPARRLAYIAKL